MSCCKSCKKRTNGLFKSCKIVLYVERNSGELCEDTAHSAQEMVNVHLERTVLHNELENKLLQLSTRKSYSCQRNQQ